MDRQRPLIMKARGKSPQIHDSVWLAPNCTIAGDVVLGEESTVWFSAIVRGDVSPIVVGRKVNIQDGAVIHGTFEKSSTELRDNVSIGHNAIVHGATVCEGALIGMGAVVMDNVIVGKGAVVAAGAVVLEGTIIEDYTLYAGVPAKKRGEVKPELREHLSKTADRYVEYAGWFKEDN